MKIIFKVVVVLFLFLNCETSLFSQNVNTIQGPAIKEFGRIFPIENPDLELSSNTEYKVLFDVFTDDSKKTKINPLINTVARFINMHVHQGVPLKNMKIAMVLHGSATRSAVESNAFKKKHGYVNPDDRLIEALVEAGVEVFVCGQSFLAHQYRIDQKSTNVKMALSALTVLTEYQTKGYQIINFN